jgi:hypothetical protein
MKDFSRKFLITKLVCSKCGDILTLSTSTPERSSHCQGEPTGADMKENLISVNPCEKCLKPAKEIMEAVKTLQGSLS